MRIHIETLAENAMLSLSHGELAKESNLEEYFENLLEVVKLPEIQEDLPSLEETQPMILRPDEIQPSFPRDDMLKNAPQTQAGCYVVPKTV